MLNERLQKTIKAEAEEVYQDINSRAQEQDSYDFGLPMVKKETGPIEEVITSYAEKWQSAEASVKARGEVITQLNNRLTNYETVKDRYEKAVNAILNLPVPLCHKTHIAWVNTAARICNEALTPKQSSDEG